MMSGSKPRRPARSPGEEVDTALMPLFDKLFRCLGAYEDKVDDIAQKMNLLTSKWVEVSEPAQLARCLQPICHRVTTID